MRLFTVSEAWGPYDCEIKERGCTNHAWTFVLSDEENESLPEETGPEAVKHILTKRLGKAACDPCLDSMELTLAKA